MRDELGRCAGGIAPPSRSPRCRPRSRIAQSGSTRGVSGSGADRLCWPSKADTSPTEAVHEVHLVQMRIAEINIPPTKRASRNASGVVFFNARSTIRAGSGVSLCVFGPFLRLREENAPQLAASAADLHHQAQLPGSSPLHFQLVDARIPGAAARLAPPSERHLWPQSPFHNRGRYLVDKVASLDVISAEPARRQAFDQAHTHGRSTTGQICGADRAT